MHIRKVTLHNIGLHQHTEQTFTRGLVGIFGRNGSGKTTLVNAIYAGLTNDFTRFHGVKSDIIRDLAGKKEKSYIEIDAEHNGIGFVLHRGLRPNVVELAIEGEKEVITKSGLVEKRLQDDLGVDMKVIGTYVFVNQWQMFNFVDHTPAVRAEAYKHLCRTEQAGVIFKACENMLADNDLSGEIIDNSDELVTQIGDADLQIEHLDEARSGHEKSILSDKALKYARKVRRKRERHQGYLEDMEEAEKREPGLRKKVALRKKILGLKQKRAAEEKKMWESAKPAADAARAALKSWDTYEKRKKRRLELAQQLRDLEVEEKEHPEPVKPDDYATLPRYRTFVSTAKQDRKTARESIEAFEQSGEGKCPKCHQAIDEAFIARQRREVTTASNVIKDLQPKIERCEQWEEDHKQWLGWQKGWAARQKAAQEELEGLQALQEPEGDKAALRADVKIAETAEAVYGAAKEAEDKARTRLTKVETLLKSLEGHIEKLETRITKTQVPDKLFDAVTKKLALHEYASLEIATINGQFKELIKKRDEAQKSLDGLRAILKRRKRLRRAMAQLAKTRDVFHWSCLPWKVAQGNLASMEESINGRLAWLGDPFWAEADENLTFKVHFPGRPARPAVDLSGGQRGIFAVAFRCGVGDVFGADIGMMFLDEPTAGLDSENVAYFEEALRQLAAEIRGKRQIVVITHAVELAQAFDQVVYCGDPSLDAEVVETATALTKE